MVISKFRDGFCSRKNEYYMREKDRECHDNNDHQKLEKKWKNDNFLENKRANFFSKTHIVT